MFRSEYADVPALELPIHDAVLGGAAAFADRPALIDGTDGTTLTYAQLDHFHRRVAAALVECGVRKGDVLALHSPNTIAFPPAFYAATRAGATVTTVHPLATADEFAKQLRDSGATWIVTVSPLLETARRAAELAGGVNEILVCDSAPGHRSLLDLLASIAPDAEVDIDPAEDIAALPYSSGTTGVPKGVMLTHRQIATNLAQLAAACSRRLGLPPVGQAYGMTELSPGTHVVPLDAMDRAPAGTVGRLIAGTEMRIVSLDDPGKDLGTGESGEILIRGPQVMKGYLNRPDATAAMIDREGWLHTGDIGRVDAGGWLFVVDRVKELIKYKGFQVAPAELEALLLTHPGVADAAVIGAYDDDRNEIPHAHVVRQADAGGLTEDEVMTYVSERVAPYKRVRKVTFIDQVPRAASGKILRRELRAPGERP